jgi:hypothetical protein
MKVKVLRAFLVKGEVQQVGKELDLADQFAVEMLQIGKVERVGAKPATAPGPMKSEASPLVAGSKPKDTK